MPGSANLFLSLIFAVIAALFACVGQAGGAGYVGVMGLFGYPPGIIKPTALTLTVLVSAIGVAGFARSGLLRTRDWYPFALLGVPGALLGGILNLPGNWYRGIVALLLLAAAARMILVGPESAAPWTRARRMRRLSCPRFWPAGPSASSPGSPAWAGEYSWCRWCCR